MSTFDPFAYLDAAAAALELPIPAKHREGVAENLVRLHAMAREVIDFPLPACRPRGRATESSMTDDLSRGGGDPASSDPVADDELP